MPNWGNSLNSVYVFGVLYWISNLIYIKETELDVMLIA